MATLTTPPLVAQELTAFYTGPLRQALRASGLNYAFGDAATGADIDDMAFDQDSHSALVEVIGHTELESGRVVAHGRGEAIVDQAIAAYTEEFGAPVTFVVEVNSGAEPGVYRDMVAKIAR